MSAHIGLLLLLESELRGKEILTIQPPAIRFFWDHGDFTYLCGKCKTILAENVNKLLPGIKVLKCNKCGSYNDYHYRK